MMELAVISRDGSALTVRVPLTFRRLRAMSRLLRTRERIVSGFCKFSNMAVPDAIGAIEAFYTSPGD